MIKSMRTFLCALVLFAAAGPAALAGPIRGELPIGSWTSTDGKVVIDKMGLRYEFDRFFGEPLERYSFRYDTDDKTIDVYTVKLRARVYLDQMAQDAYVLIDPQTDRPGKWSHDMSGSPDWDKTFKTADGVFVSAATTKSYFKRRFRLDDIEIVDISARRGTDAAYESKVSNINNSAIVAAGLNTPLDDILPKPFGYRSGGAKAFWDERKVFSYKSVGLVTTENDGHGVQIKDPNTVNWTYGGYMHEAASFDVTGAVDKIDGKDAGPVTAIITARWIDPFGTVVALKRYRHEVTGDQRIVLASRQRLPDSITFPPLKVSYSVRYVAKNFKKKEAKKSKDPLIKELSEQAAREDLSEIERARYAEHMEEIGRAIEKGEELMEEAEDEQDIREADEWLASKLASLMAMFDSPEDDEDSDADAPYAEVAEAPAEVDTSCKPTHATYDGMGWDLKRVKVGDKQAVVDGEGNYVICPDHHAIIYVDKLAMWAVDYSPNESYEHWEGSAFLRGRPICRVKMIDLKTNEVVVTLITPSDTLRADGVAWIVRGCDRNFSYFHWNDSCAGDFRVDPKGEVYIESAPQIRRGVGRMPGGIYRERGASESPASIDGMETIYRCAPWFLAAEDSQPYLSSNDYAGHRWIPKE